jgi:hypothetical protein
MFFCKIFCSRAANEGRFLIFAINDESKTITLLLPRRSNTEH